MSNDEGNTPCPKCKLSAVRCVIKEGREGSRCCPACEGQRDQRPVHVWTHLSHE